MTENKSVTVAVRMTEKERAKLLKRADQENRTISNLANHLIIQGLKK